jgi:hypothetical protein
MAAADDFGAGVDGLVLGVWENFMRIRYIVPILPASASPARWLSTLALGWLTRRAPRSCSTTRRCVACWRAGSTSAASDRAIESQPSTQSASPAPAIHSGQSVSFFQGRADIEPGGAVSASVHPPRFGTRPPDGIECDTLYLSGRASQPGMVRRWLDAPGGADIAGHPSRRRSHPGHRRRTPCRRNPSGLAARAIRRWRRSPAMRCPASSSTACRSIWSG